MPELQEYHWSEMSGNPFLTKLNPEMLLENGFKLYSESNLKTDSKRDTPKTSKYFVFNHTFVMEKIKREILKPLHCNTLADLQELLDRAEQLNKGVEG